MSDTFRECTVCMNPCLSGITAGLHKDWLHMPPCELLWAQIGRYVHASLTAHCRCAGV